MRRRCFLAMVLGLGTAINGGAALAQPRQPLIVVLMHGKESALRNRIDGLTEGLRELGYIEGRNYRMEVRWSDNQVDRLPALARELLAKTTRRCRCCAGALGAGVASRIEDGADRDRKRRRGTACRVDREPRASRWQCHGNPKSTRRAFHQAIRVPERNRAECEAGDDAFIGVGRGRTGCAGGVAYCRQNLWNYPDRSSRRQSGQARASIGTL